MQKIAKKTGRVAAALSLVAGLAAAVAFGAENAPTPIDATIVSQNELNRVDEKVYSHFLEHIYNSCNGGLWGELVWNRSLEAGSGSQWSVENGVIKQDSLSVNQKLLLGADLQAETPWTDYDVRVSAKKVAGNEGFLILFRAAPDGSSYYWANIGGWDNKFVAIEKETPKTNGGRVTVGKRVEFPPIENDRIYDIRISVVGQNMKVFLDQELILEAVDFADDAPTSGCVGVGTWATRAEYGSVLVRSLDRKTLYDSLETAPKLGSNVEVRYWNVDGNASWKNGDARNSAKYLRFNGFGELSQENFAFRAGEIYDYSFWTRGDGKATFFANGTANETTTSDEIRVGEFDVETGGEWRKISGEFRVPKTNDKATIRFNFEPNDDAFLDVDQISVFPRSWKEKTNGLRPDLLNAIKEIRPTLIRWPGGCYASAYRWKSGIGPQDDRVAYPIELWNDVDVNSFGIDEFIPFCREVGAEPVMVVNIGTKQWEGHITDVDWLQEVCDWVEYCNGPATSKWGAVRAKNGRVEPYGVKYWEIDNEVRPSDSPSEWYVDVINKLVPRMKAIDPTITIIACGSWTGDREKWDADVIAGAGKNFDYLSTHRYDDPNGFAFNPWDNQRFFEVRREMIAKSENKHIKMFDSEWNAQSTDWRTGLHAGGILNCFERIGDVLEIAAPALFLRHETANDWDNAFVNFNQTGWYPAPNYVVMKLWRDSFAPTRIELKSDAKELNGENPIVNAVATKSQDGSTLYFKAVNNLETAVEYRLTLADATAANVQATVVSPEVAADAAAKAKLFERNDFENADKIAPRPVDAKIVDGKIVVAAPSYSALVVKIDVE